MNREVACNSDTTKYPSSRPHTVRLASRSANQAVLGQAALSCTTCGNNPQNGITASTREGVQ